jgi:glycosyltransferase involved in cell wall biosynthesis
MPVYQADDYLELAIESILLQDYSDFELVISDNGSSDKTVPIAKSYARKDERVKVFTSEVNHGAAWNFNRVLSIAEGHYFKWAGHDDILLQGFFTKCIDLLDDAGSDVQLCYPKSSIINADGEVTRDYEDRMDLRQELASDRLRHYFINCRLVNFVFGIWRTQALRTAGGLPTYAHGDRVLLAKAAMNGRFLEVDERLFQRRVHEEMSWRKTGAYEGFAAWFEVANVPRVVFPTWRTSWEMVRSVGRMDTSQDERFRMLGIIVKYWTWARRGAMARELMRAPGVLARSFQGG